MIYLYVGLAGMAGALARYIVGLCFADLRPDWIFPASTLTVNVTGSWLLAYLMARYVENSRLSKEWTAAITVGFLGSFTTFSAWSDETLALLQQGYWVVAMVYVICSIVLGWLAAWAGYRRGSRPRKVMRPV